MILILVDWLNMTWPGFSFRLEEKRSASGIHPRSVFLSQLKVNISRADGHVSGGGCRDSRGSTCD
jgi:prepilin-type processing-associated H-X9-DG protein